ncbi:MAG TPA: helix-turn-helix domain-containing protein [Burkholderiaceae bacterium]|nr:helix-turn-helix domain-containing protein [Burkholderiaceae bacterium]
MNEAQAIGALGALAHPLRLRVFRALVVVGPPGLSAGAIMEGVGVPAATLSFHLKELTAAGLVSQQRSGRNFVYRAAYAQMNGLLAYLTENCCAGAACAGQPSQAACGC